MQGPCSFFRYNTYQTLILRIIDLFGLCNVLLQTDMRYVQIWSWEHFAVARPIVRPGHLPAAFGGADADVRHAYGVKWSGPKRFIDQAKGCLNVLRNQFESLLEGDIVW